MCVTEVEGCWTFKSGYSGPLASSANRLQMDKPTIEHDMF